MSDRFTLTIDDPYSTTAKPEPGSFVIYSTWYFENPCHAILAYLLIISVPAGFYMAYTLDILGSLMIVGLSMLAIRIWDNW